MSHQLTLERTIGRPVGDVFNALAQGKLFMNCGAASDTIRVDFRVGGDYFIQFKNKTLKNFGTFLEILPNKKIVFSWCQEFGPEQKPDTQVTIELFPEGEKTRLVLVHAGFNTSALCEAHSGGWTAGLTDMAAELEEGSLRFLRTFETPVEKLFSTCQNPASFFAFMGELAQGSVDFRVGGKYQLPTAKGEIKGEFLEIVPNQKITFSWQVGCSGPLENSNVTLNFIAADASTSKLELIHKGLMLEEDQKAHRSGWEAVTNNMRQLIQVA